jgi:hypothetical protein
MQLLGVDSNLTESPLSLYNTLIELIKLRASKVLIFIINSESSPEQRGIHRFSKKELF